MSEAGYPPNVIQVLDLLQTHRSLSRFEFEMKCRELRVFEAPSALRFLITIGQAHVVPSEGLEPERINFGPSLG